MQRYRNTRLLCFILLVLLALTACGSGENAAPAPQPDQEALTAGTDAAGDSPDHTADNEASAQESGDEEQTASEEAEDQPAQAEDTPAAVEHPTEAHSSEKTDSGKAAEDNKAAGKNEGTQEKEPASSQPEPAHKEEQAPVKTDNAKPAEKTDNATPAEKTNPTPADSAASEQSGQVHVVEIVDFAFSPSKLTIKAGDSVKFINKDAVRHSATADNDSFDTGMLGKDKAKEITFSEDGEFTYFCLPHPAMIGTIIVTAN